MTAGIADDATAIVGDTPLVRLDTFGEAVLGKVESVNPLSSVKDRVAVSMLDAAERDGEVGPETVIVEATSGNTGIGLAMACAARGYRLRLTMPASATAERVRVLRSLGAAVTRTPAEDGMAGAVERAEEIRSGLADTFAPRQFENPANPAAHRATTGPEIWRDTDGDVDVLVAATGTGGTITGISAHFEEDRGQPLHSIAVEPAASPVLSGGDPAPHDIPGMGPGFVPEVLRRDLVDEVRTVTRDEAVSAARRLATGEGLLAGLSAGGALHVAAAVARERPRDRIVVVLPDTGERYLTTGLWEGVA